MGNYAEYKEISPGASAVQLRPSQIPRVELA